MPFPEPASEYFKWRDLPPNERPPIPADLERRKVQEAVAPSEPARPFLAKADYEEIQKLIEKVNTLQFSEVTIRRNDLNLSLRAAGLETARVTTNTAPVVETAGAPAPAPAAAAPAPAPDTSGPAVVSPLSGTFYRSPGPGKPNFSEEGDVIKAGERVCIVEAMKLFNQIKAPENCKLLKFLVKHGEPVKKGQPLCQIEPI